MENKACFPLTPTDRLIPPDLNKPPAPACLPSNPMHLNSLRSLRWRARFARRRSSRVCLYAFAWPLNQPEGEERRIRKTEPRSHAYECIHHWMGEGRKGYLKVTESCPGNVNEPSVDCFSRRVGGLSGHTFVKELIDARGKLKIGPSPR